jgi:hypothetical protein
MQRGATQIANAQNEPNGAWRRARIPHGLAQG